MSLEEEYNKIISDKLDSRSFTPTEEDWQDALVLIKANEEKNKRRFFIWFFLFVVIGGATLLYIVNTNNVTESRALSDKTEKNNLNFNLSEQTSNGINFDVKKKNTGTAGIKKTDEVSELQNSVEEKNKLSNGSSEKENTNPASPKSALNNSASTKQNIRKTTITNKITYPSKATEQKNNVEAKASDKGVIAQERDDAKSYDDKTKQNNDVKPIDELAINISKSLSNADSLPRQILKDSVATLPLITAKKDSAITQLVPATETEKLNKVNTFEIFAIGGIQYTPIKNAGGSISKFINPGGGLYFIRTFSNGFGFGSGCLYSIYSANEQEPRKFSSVIQEFGYKKQVIEISPTKFHYLKIPILASYSFGKNKIFFGPQFSYMINCRSSINTYEESYGVISNLKNTRSFGYLNGINKYDVSFLLSYSRSVYRRFGVGASFDYGLIDTKKDSYYQSNNFDRNISIQVFINYKIK